METSTGTTSTILLWFTTTRIGNQQTSVVGKNRLSDIVLSAFVDVLGVVGDNGLGNGRSNGVNLGSDTSTLDADANVDIAEPVLSEDQDGLEPLLAKLLLPSFGGGFQVWTTCLMLFQGLLFLGYLYCHWLAPKIGRCGIGKGRVGRHNFHARVQG